MQNRNSLCVEICSSGVAEQASEIFWIIIELNDLL